MKPHENPKIAFLSYTLTGGGAERNTINLAAEFNKSEWPSDIFIIKPIIEYTEGLNRKENNGNIIPLLSTVKPLSAIDKVISGIVILFKLCLYVYIRKYRILVGGISFYPYYLTVICAKLTGTKSVLIVGSSLKEEINERRFLNRFIHRFLHLFCMRFADRIICVSGGLKSEIVKIFPFTCNKIDVVYNGVNVRHIQHFSEYVVPKQFISWAKGNKVIAFVGRLSKEKNPMLLLKIYQKLKSKIPSAKLCYFGKGPMRSEIIRFIKKNKLENNVTMMGFVDNYRMYLKYASVLAVTSKREGFGNVIIEAMAGGLPVVSIDCDYGPREIMKADGISYGLLAKNEKEFMQSLETILNSDKQRRMYSKLGLRRARFFSLYKTHKLYVDVFAGLLGFCGKQPVKSLP